MPTGATCSASSVRDNDCAQAAGFLSLPWRTLCDNSTLVVAYVVT